MPFLNYFFGSSIILSNFLGFAHFSGNLFISIKIRVAYTYVLKGLKIQFCLRSCLTTGLGEILIMMMLFGLQIKWNQNHHKTYTGIHFENK